MPLSVDEIKTVMKFQLKNFNDEGGKINDNTIHNTVLRSDDGFGQANSKNIYQAFMLVTFKKHHQGNPNWPSDWLDMRVVDLAAKLA